MSFHARCKLLAFAALVAAVGLGRPLATPAEGLGKPVEIFRAGKVTLEAYARQASEDDQTVLEFFASNVSSEEMDLTLTFQLENLQARPGARVRVILRPRRIQVAVARLAVVDGTKSYRYRLRMRVYRGNPGARHRGDYLVPYGKDRTFAITNAFFGKGGHASQTKHAVDFPMPVGTPIHAARTGVVVLVKQDSNEGGPDPRLASKGNFVAVRHKDGTYAFYAHLRKNGAIVQVGQLVFGGWKIGYSGNTGYSTGPHLHFHVAVADGRGGFRTVPWKFRLKKGGSVRLLRPRVGLRLQGAGE